MGNAFRRQKKKKKNNELIGLEAGREGFRRRGRRISCDLGNWDDQMATAMLKKFRKETLGSQRSQDKPIRGLR